MENDTLLLYEDIVQGAHMGIAAIEELMKRTEDARFQAELERTRSDYQYILDQAEEQIAARGEKPKELSMVTRLNTWGMVTAATIFRQAKGKQEWYVGAITDEHPRTATIPFSFLPEGRKYIVTAFLFYCLAKQRRKAR